MGTYFAQYEPGSTMKPADPHFATLLKAGSDIVFQIHYTPNGKATTDQVKIGFIFSDRPPDMKYLAVNAMNPTFVIPPGAQNYKVEACIPTRTCAGRLMNSAPSIRPEKKKLCSSATITSIGSSRIFSISPSQCRKARK
jgi:hypothetical protein